MSIIITPLVRVKVQKTKDNYCSFVDCQKKLEEQYIVGNSYDPLDLELCPCHKHRINQGLGSIERVFTDSTEWGYFWREVKYTFTKTPKGSETIVYKYKDMTFSVTTGEELVWEWFNKTDRWKDAKKCLYVGNTWQNPDCMIYFVIMSCIQRDLIAALKKGDIKRVS